MIRSFIAIDFPQETREKLAAIQEQLKQSRAGVRWVKPAGIHLTLKFLGNILPAVGLSERYSSIMMKRRPL